MKILFLYTILFFLSFPTFCQNKNVICGKLLNIKDYKISIYAPVDGYHNESFIITNTQQDFIVVKDSFYYAVNAPIWPSFYMLYITTQNEQFVGIANILMTKGDSLHLNFNLEKNDYTWIRFSGDNAEGNNLFNKINYQPYDKYIPLLNLLNNFTKDTSFFLNKIDYITDTTTNGFHMLLLNKKISNEFYDAMLLTFKMLFYCEFARKLYETPSKVSGELGIEKRNKIILSIYNNLNPTTPKLMGLSLSGIYITGYFSFLYMKEKGLSYTANLEDHNEKITIGDSLINIDRLLVGLLKIEPKETQEILWFFYLTKTFRLAKGYFNSSVIDQYAYIFPNSKYIKYLRQSFEENKPILSNQYVLSQPINVVDSVEQYQTIEQIINNNFKNIPVFVDLWASWCGPCINEFENNSSLDSFLLKNNIEKLYLSLDGNNKGAWLNGINKYKLGGKHVLAGQKLIGDIKRTLNINEQQGIGIPRYIVINKRGKILYNNAYRPSQRELLFMQLKESLR